MGETFAQKILSRKVGKKVTPGEIVTVSPDYVLSHDNTRAIIDIFCSFGLEKVRKPEKIVIILDHVVPPSNEQYAENHKIIREFVKKEGIPNFFDINTGICHQVFPENGFALPGKLIVGADSHTTTHGAFGSFSIGIGRSEVASIWALDEIWLMVPETIKIVIKGELKPYTFSKDVILFIIGQVGSDGALYKAVEFAGDLIRGMNISDRMVLCNMAAEMGAKAAFIEPDEKTEAWLKGRAREEFELIKSDEDAKYCQILTYDISELTPQVACPHTVDNVVSVDQVEGIRIDLGLIGTCTNGRIEDLEVARKILKGKKVKEGVRTLVFPASWEVYRKALKRGILYDLAEAGCIIMNPGCGPCLGAHEGVLAPGEIALSTANRNFKGRMGSKEAGIYLSSPATVAASVIEGKITNPEKYLV